jgi:hypothetical protein
MSITYAPSATALVRAPQVPAAAADVSEHRLELFAIGSPQLAPDTIEQMKQSAPGWALRPAPESSQELKTIGDGVDWEKTVAVEGSGATEAALRERAPRAAVIHVAAPFRVNGASPLFSEILLAPDEAHDATLEAREIINLDLQAKAGVLSDGGALAMMEASDEVPVVAWAWRAAGVPALVIHRWTSEPEMSSAFLKALHVRLRAGDAPAAALRAARAAIKGKAPFDWAGWMIAAW